MPDTQVIRRCWALILTYTYYSPHSELVASRLNWPNESRPGYRASCPDIYIFISQQYTSQSKNVTSRTVIQVTLHTPNSPIRLPITKILAVHNFLSPRQVELDCVETALPIPNTSHLTHHGLCCPPFGMTKLLEVSLCCILKTSMRCDLSRRCQSSTFRTRPISFSFRPLDEIHRQARVLEPGNGA